MGTAKSVNVGMKIDMASGPQFYGTDEVNQLIAEGWRVSKLQIGGVNFAKQQTVGDTVQLIFSGCDIVVVLER